jgi:hypothetical protein
LAELISIAGAGAAQSVQRTCYRLDGCNSIPISDNDGILIFTTASKPPLGHTQAPIKWVPGALTLEVKQLGHEAHHLPPSIAKVKNVWSYTSTLSIHHNSMVLN